MKTTGIARAHTNIALIKYWGKKDKALFLPMNSSLSLTLEAFYTDTKITLDETLEKDEFYLNNVLQQEAETQKISKFLDLFRIPAKETRFARIESYNFVPTAAGLASSASAFAALAGAMHQAMGWDYQEVNYRPMLVVEAEVLREVYLVALLNGIKERTPKIVWRFRLTMLLGILECSSSL